MIRPATVADVPVILALIRELAEYEKLREHCVATEELLRENLFGAAPAAQALIAEVEESGSRRIVGYAIYFKTFSTFLAKPGLYLEDIYVQAPYRGRGLGRAMLRHLAQLAIANHYERVEWCVLDWNAPSIAFYKSLGAIPMDEWTVYRLTGAALPRFARG